MGRIWVTSKYPPESSVTLFQIKIIQGHNVKIKTLSLGGVTQVFGSDFRQKRKK